LATFFFRRYFLATPLTFVNDEDLKYFDDANATKYTFGGFAILRNLNIS
jgi:hypothetical protein